MQSQTNFLHQEEVPYQEEESLGHPKKKQRKRPKEDEKICRVCGDKALAHNFDAITCESCKAFFRRNALRKEASVFILNFYIRYLDIFIFNHTLLETRKLKLGGHKLYQSLHLSDYTLMHIS